MFEPTNRVPLRLTAKNLFIDMDVEATLKHDADNGRLVADQLFVPPHLMLDAADILNISNDDPNATVPLHELKALIDQLNQSPAETAEMEFVGQTFNLLATTDADWQSPEFAQYDIKMVADMEVLMNNPEDTLFTDSPTVHAMLNTYLQGNGSEFTPPMNDRMLPLAHAQPGYGPASLLIKGLATSEKLKHGIDSDNIAELWPLVKERIESTPQIRKLGDIIERFTNPVRGNLDNFLNALEQNSQIDTLNEMLVTPFVNAALKEQAKPENQSPSDWPAYNPFWSLPNMNIANAVRREYAAEIVLNGEKVEGVALVNSKEQLLGMVTPNEIEPETLIAVPGDYPVNARSLITFYEDRPDIELEMDEAPEEPYLSTPRI